MQTMDLKSWLEREKLTQEAFEAQSGISQSIISRACNGVAISSENMVSLYNATGGAVTPNWLVLAAKD